MASSRLPDNEDAPRPHANWTAEESSMMNWKLKSSRDMVVVALNPLRHGILLIVLKWLGVGVAVLELRWTSL